MQDYLDGKPLFEVFTVECYLDIMALLPSSQYQVILIDKNGRRLADSAVTSLKHDGGKGVELPVDMYVVHEAAPDRDLPDIIRIDCTGLGGHDLGGPDPWHICIRSDRHGQSIYGPSLATTEVVLHHPMKRPRHMVRRACMPILGVFNFVVVNLCQITQRMCTA